MTPDDDLIRSAASGDDAAFAALMRRYLSPVYGFAASLAGNAEDAEDIAQESLFKAWKHLKRFRLGSPFKTWLFAIARNTAIDYARKKRPALFAELTQRDDEDFEHGVADEKPDAGILFDREIEAAAMNSALEQLSAPYREVLGLHYREEFTLQEISEILKIPLNTVKSRDRRALKALRGLLAPKGEQAS